MVSKKYRNASIYFERINEMSILYPSLTCYIFFMVLIRLKIFLPILKRQQLGGLSILNNNSYLGTYHRKGLLTGKIMTFRKGVYDIPGQRASGRALTGYLPFWTELKEKKSLFLNGKITRYCFTNKQQCFTCIKTKTANFLLNLAYAQIKENHSPTRN